jgi:hypothetical protein
MRIHCYFSNPKSVREQKRLGNTVLNENSAGSKQRSSCTSMLLCSVWKCEVTIYSDQLYLLMKETTVFLGKVTSKAVVCQWMWGAQNCENPSYK